MAKTKVIAVDVLDSSYDRSVICDAIRFTLPGGQQVEVMIRQDDPDSLDIRSNTGSLSIIPWASNAIKVKAGRF